MVPICYEMGVGGGATNGCSEFLNLATEMYVKKMLSDLLDCLRSNGDRYIKTAAYKSRLEKEEAMWLREEGGVVRNAAGLLPVEVEAGEGRRAFGMGDLRLALKVSDDYIHQAPIISAKVNHGWIGDGGDWGEDGEEEEEDDLPKGSLKVNGVASHSLMNGHINGDEMDIDGVDLGWSGGGASDRDALGGLLDDCLTI